MRVRLAAIIACLVLLGAVTASGVGAQTTQKTQPITVKVGNIIPIDSQALSFKDAAVAVQASVDGFNRRQSRIKFVLDQCDSRGDPNGETACAREMVANGVVATIGDVAAFNPSGVNSILLAAGIPRVALTVLGLDEFSSAVSYPWNSGPILGTAPLGQVLADEGVKKVSFVRVDLPSTASMVGLLKPTFTKLGIEIVSDVPIPPTASDFSQYVAAAAANGATTAVYALTPAQIIPLLQQAAQLEPDLTWATASSAFSTQDVIDAKNENVVIIGPMVYPNQANVKRYPGIKVFLDDMKKAKKPELAPNKLAQPMLPGWLALQAIVQVTKDMQTIDSASLSKALDSAQNIDMSDIIPPWTPGTPGPTQVFSRISNPYWYKFEFTGTQLKTPKQEPIDLTAVFVPPAA